MQRKCKRKLQESIERAAAERPATLYVFDLLTRGKRDLRPASFASRRHVRVVGQWADGPARFKSVTAHGLEGVVGKRRDARTLRDGRRTG